MIPKMIPKMILKMIQDDSKDDPNDPPAIDSSTPELAKIAADLQLTDTEQARIQEDGRIKAATRALQKAERELTSYVSRDKKVGCCCN